MLLCRTLLLIAGQSQVCSNASFALYVASAWKIALLYAAKVSDCIFIPSMTFVAWHVIFEIAYYFARNLSLILVKLCVIAIFIASYFLVLKLLFYYHLVVYI